MLQTLQFPPRDPDRVSMCSPGMDGLSEGQCMVCGDRSAGKHYGVMACYGCKGFFRRTIRSGQSYSCRFTQKCSIDKDQRNACRFCRFQRCLNVGMEPDAIRPDRDIIGKQKNPRRKKMKREGSNLPSPGPDSPSQHEDMLMSILVDVEMRASAGVTNSMMPIGIGRIKDDPDFDIGSLFINRHIFADNMFEMSYAIGPVASAELLRAAMRRYVLSCIHWVDSIFGLCQISNIQERVAVLRAVFAPYCLFSQAARTSQISQDPDVVCICNRSVVPRKPPQYLMETNLLSNNIMGRVLDELVSPMRKVQLSESELVALTTLIVLDSEAPGISTQTAMEIGLLRDRVQTALFQLIRERLSPEHSIAAVTSRFGNILLLLPPLAKVSSLVAENINFARLFGSHNVDPLLMELFSDNSHQSHAHHQLPMHHSEMNLSMPTPLPSISKELADVSTQTQSLSPVLPSDLSDMLSNDGNTHNEPPPVSVCEPPRPAPLVVPPSYNPFYFNGNHFPNLPQSAPYATGYQTSFFDGSQSAPDPTRTFRFM